MRASAELEALSRRLLELLGRITGLESTYLTAIHWDEGEQEILYARNVGALEIGEGLRVAWSDTLCKRALDGGSACTSDVPSTYPDSEAAAALGLRTYVTVPVTDRRGEVVGTVCGASGSSIDVPDDVRDVMVALAGMIELQLANDLAVAELADANAALHDLAFADGLTGVGNRRSLEAHLERCRAGGARSTAVVAVDVDHFKGVNDTHGHGAGDDVLRAVADRLRTVVRAEDVVARLGGDEFVVLLTGTDVGRAEQTARRLRDDIARAPIPTRAGPVAVTVSVGVADGGATDADDLLQLADTALYVAKAEGRDGVAVSAPA